MVGYTMSIEAFSSLAVAIGTLALATVALIQIRISQRQVSTSERSLEATKEAVVATEQAALETARARIDAKTFRVVPEFREPMWPPLLHTTLTRVPGGGEPALLDSSNIHASRDVGEGDVFTFPREESQLLWFRAYGLLRNEGDGTAFIYFPSTCRVVSDIGPYADVANIRPHERITGHFRPGHVLEPGESMVIEWASGRPLSDWADAYENPNPPNPRGALFLEIVARDTFQDGVTDNLYITIQGLPIEPVTDEQGRWRLRRQPSMVASEYPTVRRRRGLDPEDVQPPWSETFNISGKTS